MLVSQLSRGLARKRCVVEVGDSRIERILDEKRSDALKENYSINVLDIPAKSNSKSAAATGARTQNTAAVATTEEGILASSGEMVSAGANHSNGGEKQQAKDETIAKCKPGPSSRTSSSNNNSHYNISSNGGSSAQSTAPGPKRRKILSSSSGEPPTPQSLANTAVRISQELPGCNWLEDKIKNNRIGDEPHQPMAAGGGGTIIDSVSQEERGKHGEPST